MNNVVSQSVPHLHVHVVPRTKGDGLRGFFWPRTTLRRGRAGRVRDPAPRGARRLRCRATGPVAQGAAALAWATSPRRAPVLRCVPPARPAAWPVRRATDAPETAMTAPRSSARRPSTPPSTAAAISTCRVPGVDRRARRGPARLRHGARAPVGGRRVRRRRRRGAAAAARVPPGDRLPGRRAGDPRRRGPPDRRSPGRPCARPGVAYLGADAGARRLRPRGASWPPGVATHTVHVPLAQRRGRPPRGLSELLANRRLTTAEVVRRREVLRVRELLQQRPQDVLHDPAVAVVVRLTGGVDPDHGVELDVARP